MYTPFFQQGKPIYISFDPPTKKGKTSTFDVVTKMNGTLLENGEHKKGAIYRFEIKDDGAGTLTVLGQNGQRGLVVFGYIKPKATTI